MSKSILKQLKESEREVRRNLIINAAKRLFKQKTFHEIGMRDIASEAGISVASLYQYFPSQDDLYVEILTSDIMNIKKRLWDTRTTLSDIATDIVYFLVDNEDIFQMMSHFMIKGEKNQDALTKFNAIQVLFLDMLEKSLMKSGPIENTGPVSKAFFAALFGNVIAYRNYPFKNKKERLDTLRQAAIITARALENTSITQKEAPAA